MLTALRALRLWSVVSCGVLLGLFLFLVSLVDAAEPEGSLAERTLQRRAIEAVIWGMPAVNYDLMLQEMLTKTDGKVEPDHLLGAVRSTGTIRR